MTRNQIEYAKLREQQRTNQAQEALTSLRDQRSYEVSTRSLDESARHNQALEMLEFGRMSETGRHNRETERAQSVQLQETARHNRETETLGTSQLAEQQRSNMVREVETQRSNIAREAETARSNMAREAETYRSNLVREVTDAGRLAELVRSDLATEAERKRSAQAQEQLRAAQLAEQIRHNMIMETKDFKPSISVTTPAVEVPVSVDPTIIQQSPDVNISLQPSHTPGLTDGSDGWNPHFGDFFDIFPY